MRGFSCQARLYQLLKGRSLGSRTEPETAGVLGPGPPGEELPLVVSQQPDALIPCALKTQVSLALRGASGFPLD